MRPIRVICVVGARPNFIKMAPIVRALRGEGRFDVTLVHSGQHYDERMSGLFFKQLGLPQPDVNLGVGGGSHAIQTARIMEAFEPVLLERHPDVVIVVGDVNSTLACSLVAVKLGVAVAHVEAGLRSFDRGMPEEINRILTDAISDLLFTTEESANDNLLKEGVDLSKIRFVGNVMIDTLQQSREAARASTICEMLGISSKEYGVLTLHRPSNVDDQQTLTSLIEAAAHAAASLPVVFPCHPRTRVQIEKLTTSIDFSTEGPALRGSIRLIEPLGYLDFLKLTDDARIVLTDSGGLQEETTVLGVRCLTLREGTERPVTVSQGSNEIVGTSKANIVGAIDRALAEPLSSPSTPELWDGYASERIAACLQEHFKAISDHSAKG